MGTINFSDYTWIIKDSNGEKQGPRQNYYSPENVSVDKEKGELHLKITYRAHRWYCSEVYLAEPLGYGTYTFLVGSRFDSLDPQAVVGLFLYGDEADEIDIELSRWGNEQTNNLWYVLHKPKPEQNPRNSIKAVLGGDWTTHQIFWKPEAVSFQSFYGHHDETPASEDYHLATWSFEKPYGSPAKECVHINLWLSEEQPPFYSREVEVIITKFDFVSRSSFSPNNT